VAGEVARDHPRQAVDRRDDLHAGEPLYVPLDLVHDLLQVVRLAGHGRNADGRSLPQVLVSRL